ncbi:hypothetical protein SAMN05444274_107128 [Mariniphaga anaerophila]|uniref:Uncharacterized protein n=1 Tax=Mariniphaga anaerophila TaxID=1484053 RepID=A0A1M5DJD6_9BACT|nr:hypothetical protein [Mariniphaga anaerophila]SHF67093.1 hypothetical protein SAMN05444274_107128 [Mariniphaga anaerophila]
MKTMKAQLSQIFLVTFLIAILVSGNVDAEGNEMIVVSGLENTVEPGLVVEDWMVTEDCWLTAESDFFVATDHDEDLSVEFWMLDKSKWGLAAFDYASTDHENRLELEKWMVNEMFWN